MQVALLRDDKRRTNYSAFTRTIDSFKTEPALAVFTSTASRLYELAPPRSMHPSDRVVANDTIPVPFWEVPFDVHARETVMPADMLTLEETTTIAHLVKFGRPL